MRNNFLNIFKIAFFKFFQVKMKLFFANGLFKIKIVYLKNKIK